MSWTHDAGRVVLDFVNTLEWRGREQSEESLNSYTDLIEWANEGGLLDEADVELITSTSTAEPKKADSVLKVAKDLREGLYRIFSNVVDGSSPETNDIEILNNTITSTMAISRLEWGENRLTWGWRSGMNVLDRILWLIAQDAVDLLSDGMLSRVGECADDRGCAYLFIDTTRNHSRKWCSMESCGNRAKARKHYGRKKLVEGTYR
jgi:predicted RNA-binding Zn ribbon-like protein